MYRWLAVLRLVLVVNAVGLNIYRGGFEHPVGGAVLLGVHGGLELPDQLGLPRLPSAYDGLAASPTCVVALASVVLTSVVKESGFHATVPGFWIMGAVLRLVDPLAAVRRRGRGPAALRRRLR